jgi:predicted neutral ceramidase superfamily lipid hydrolase
MTQAGKSETKAERIDRELIELLNELRVALPGVQVLFAFLLTVPFSQRFTAIDSTQKTAFYLAFLCTAIASVLFIAPTVIHRLRFREKDKENVLRRSHQLTIAGSIFLIAAITIVVFFITDVLYGAPLSIIVTAFIGGLGAIIWYAMPLSRRSRGATSGDEEG